MTTPRDGPRLHVVPPPLLRRLPLTLTWAWKVLCVPSAKVSRT